MARSVLVVDDNALNRDLLYEELTFRGMEVVTAAGGRDALELLRQQSFDVVLLDIMMPGVDGLAVLREIRKTKSVAELPIIMTTARDTRSSVVDALDAGANDYVTKPIDLLVLMARIRTQIALKDANDAAATANQRLEEAQRTILQLTGGGGAAGDVEGWATSLARDLSQLMGARVEVVLNSGQTISSGSTRQTASPGVYIDPAEQTRAISIGTGASRFGELVVARTDWSERERMLLEAFARQLAAALEMRRLRTELTVAQTRVVTRRQELLDRGIPLLQICTKCGRCYDHTVAACPIDDAPLESPQILPYRVNQRYRLTQRLATGGMARLFAAVDEKLDRAVAVKIIKAEHFHDDELRVRFEQEARAVARIEHPGVSTAYDSGELEDSSLFFVMELLRGLNLAQMLHVYGKGAPKQVASLVRQAGAALAAVHRSGFIHRDVKPENIFLLEDRDGFKVKLLDFGIAKRLGSDANLTQSGTFIGTPAYMAPEQVEESDADARTDLYSFAAVAYEALTGRRVTTEREVAKVFREIVHVMPPPVSSIVPEVSPALDQLFDTALAKVRDERPPSLELWAADVARILETMDGPASWPESFAPSVGFSTPVPTVRHV
jgi:CheY-like chemotaxis protein/tRNA A-37 threonylcarbamoyl transferase component Bud32